MAFGRLGSMGAGGGRLGARAHLASGVVGGDALLVGESAGFATDFTYATDAQRVAVKVAGVTTSYALDSFFVNAGTSPKMVFDAAGTLVWSPHNMFLNSAAPVTQSVTTVVGQNYTVTIVGSGSMTGSAGASGVATAGAPLTYTATTTTSTFTKAGTVTQIQMNRGAVATTYIATTGAIKNGLAVDYNPVTHAALGLLCEPAATNLLLNNAALSTQSVTVTAVAHTLTFFGTGTITLTGVSTAGPLVGTGTANRVSLTFTPTAGSLTLTVTGTVSNAQLEIGTVATSLIPTFGASATRALDAYSCTPASINHSATAGSWWCENYMIGGGGRMLAYGAGSCGPIWHNSAAAYQIQDGTSLSKSVVTALFGNIHKTASAFQSGDRAITVDGQAVATDAGSTALLLAPTTILFGAGVSGAGAITGYVRKIRYVPRRKTNPEMVTETT
jgi:hypothetical protein